MSPAKLIPVLNEECDHAFSEEIGPSSDWKCFMAADLIGKVMHRTTSRVLIGPELCRDKTYLKTSQKLANSIFIHGVVMSMLPFRSSLRMIYDFCLTAFHNRNLRKAMKAIVPVVEARFEEFQMRDRQNKGREKGMTERIDAIEWSLDISKGNAKEHNPQWIALSLLHNIWAGSAAPAGLVTQMLFQVLVEPSHKYLEPLRAEAMAAVEAHGGFTHEALGNMPLTDSFIREINRVYPVGSVTCARTITDPGGIRFHDGLELPYGSKVAVPALAIQTDSDNFRDPLIVDGFRFANLRRASACDGSSDGAQKGPGTNWGATTVSETNLA